MLKCNKISFSAKGICIVRLSVKSIFAFQTVITRALLIRGCLCEFPCRVSNTYYARVYIECSIKSDDTELTNSASASYLHNCSACDAGILH